MRKLRLVWITVFAALLAAACAPTPLKISDYHITPTEKPPLGSIPKPVLAHQEDRSIPAVELGRGLSHDSEDLMDEVCSVVVNNVDLRELLFALSRDAEIDVDDNDIYPIKHY